jgi:hypothetical protein
LARTGVVPGLEEHLLDVRPLAAEPAAGPDPQVELVLEQRRQPPLQPRDPAGSRDQLGDGQVAFHPDRTRERNPSMDSCLIAGGASGEV